LKILLIRLSSLGDAILATAAVEALAALRPDAEIHVLTKPAFGEVFAGNPHVRRVIEWGRDESPRTVAGKLLPEDYALIVDLHANLRTRLLRFFLPGRWSVYRKGAARRRLFLWFGFPTLPRNVHVLDRYLAALAPVMGTGGVPRRVLPRLYPDKAAQEKASALLSEAGWDGRAPLVALAPGARWPTKAWPEPRWTELAGMLGAKGFFPVLVGGANEKALAEGILSRAACRGAVVAGRTGLVETAALLQLCRALVTNDSAPLHMATAVGTPVVAIFGPTVRGFGFYPVGPRDRTVEADAPCRPCRLHGGEKCPKGHFDCMEKISATEVFSALQDALAP
jgi:heptosyltransferase-2